MKNNIPIGEYKSAGVYQILNTVNGKSYIGSTVNLYRRFSQHKNSLLKGTNSCLYLNRAYKKYGPEAFEFNLLEAVDIVHQPISLLTDVEDMFIKLHKSNNRTYGYNLRQIARSCLGMKQSEEFKAKKRKQKMNGDHPFRLKQKGENHPLAKLTTPIVRQIKLLLAKGWRDIDIANYLKINASYITNVKRGVCWRTVTVTKEEVDSYNEPITPTGRVLNVGLVKQIKYLLSVGERAADIAEHFDCSYAIVFHIRNELTFSEVILTPADYELFKSTISADFLHEAKGRVELKTFNSFKKAATKGPSTFSPMTKENVIEIKQLLESKATLKSISRRFNVTEETVTKIRSGKLFSSINMPIAKNMI